MKYGVIVYKNTQNIGDDVQSYAASCLLPQVDYYIEREHLDVFRPAEPEPVNVIMNGWFMYNKMGWPVSPCINPLYLSMHFWTTDALDINDLFLQGVGAEDLKAHEPIGCRDLETSHFLENAGIRTWMSGCVTLTLNPVGQKSVQPYVCLTDVSPEVEEFVRNRYPDLEIRILTQESPDLIPADADWTQRFAKVRELLQVYQNASAVITTRLHCAMPCLALQTPVLLLSDKAIAENSRFDGLSELAHHATVEEYLAGKVDFDLLNPPANPEAYLELRQGIQEKVARFLQENQTCTPELKARYLRYDGEWERRALWKNELAIQLQQRAIERWKKDHDWLTELTASRDWFREQSEADQDTIRQQNKTIEAQEIQIQNLENKVQIQSNQINCLQAEKEELNQQIWNLRHPVRRVINKLSKRK